MAISRGRASLSGVYVATGALGLFLGGAFCWELLAVMIAIFAMALLAFGFVAFRKWFSVRRLEMAKRSHHVGKSIGEEVVFSKGVIVAIICLLLTICMRSYLGMIMRFPWKDSFVISFIFVAMVMLGKMAGGVVGDYFGWRRTAVVSLIISAMLFGFGFDNSVCGIAGVFLFNFTMPITLVALANLFPHHYGLVFGATTLALFVGALPVLLGLGGSMFNPFGLGISIFVSALVLGVGLTLYYRIQSDG